MITELRGTRHNSSVESRREREREWNERRELQRCAQFPDIAKIKGWHLRVENTREFTPPPPPPTLKSSFDLPLQLYFSPLRHSRGGGSRFSPRAIVARFTAVFLPDGRELLLSSSMSRHVAFLMEETSRSRVTHDFTRRVYHFSRRVYKRRSVTEGFAHFPRFSPRGCDLT